MPRDCHDTALYYLEHRERSVYEVKSHLISKGFQEEEIEEELNDLKELRFVDDVRYCSDYLRYGIGKGRGPVRLQMELSEKGIDAALIKEAIEVSFPHQSEREAAMKEARKLLDRGVRLDDEQTGPDEKTIAKIGRKLASLGYHTDIIYDIIRQIRKS
ncbi:MAG TPA: regulatory protein RecX [Anaerovoracaceae bacterium]|nr:regulatory protein RecX [Anaerovoracaceae bacterium]